MKNLTAVRLVYLLAMTCGMLQAQTTKSLSPLTSFGFRGDGSIQPGDQPWVDSADMNQRGIAYDPVSGNIVYVNTKSGSAGAGGTVMGTIEILNGSTGSEISTLNTNGIGGGSYADFAVGVADDGVVYICNHVTASGTVPFKIYRWDSVTSVDPPLLAFNSTLTPTQRYGSSMDIRGGGVNTQIIIGSMPGGIATNVVIFTTVDGTNFTANVLGTDATAANFNDGIAFGAGDTFWAKRVGAPLRYMSFNLATLSAVTLAVYTTTNMATVQNLGPIAVDATNGLLAAIEMVGGTVTSAPERVWMFDISDPTKVPAALGQRDFSPNFQNSLAPLGFLDFGGGKLYAAVTRNGILVSSVDTGTMPLPIITKDLFATNRVAVGQTATFEVQAYPNVTGYEWRLNETPISGETNYFLNVPNVQTNDSGRIYSVQVSNPAGSTLSSNSVLHVVNPSDLFHLNRLWSAAPGVSPGPTNWYTGTGGGVPTERSIAYNSLSNQVYCVFRSGVNVRIAVVDAETGYLLHYLKTNGIIFGANIPLCAIAVADDGAIYACNSVAPTDAANFRIYRWENSHPDTINTLIFQGNPAPDVTSGSYRWGDNMDVRGSGIDTEIIFDAQNETRYIGVLHPNDASMATWTAKGYLLQNVPTGPGGGAGGVGIGRSLQFGEGDTFWQKRWAAAGAVLTQSGYEPASPGTVAPLILSSSAQPLYTNGPVGINFSLKLAAAVNFANGGSATTVPDKLDLYDLTSPVSPVLLNRYNFPVNALANGNRIAQVIFTTNYVFALDANNGVLAFQVASGPIPPPSFLTQPKNLRIIEGGTGALTVVLDQTATVEWFKDGSSVGTGTTYAINNAQTNAIGSYWAVAANNIGSATSQVVQVTVGLTDDNYRLSQAWSTVPGTALGTSYVTSNGGANTPNERYFAYNSISNQLLFVQCPAGGANTPTVHVVDASNGTKLYNLHTEGFSSSASEVAGSNPINMLGIGVAEDGAVYACNGTPNASGGSDGSTAKMLHLYRWTDSGPDTFLTDVFMGDPSGQSLGINVRWGDALSVRGSGVSTEVLLDSNDGNYVGILKPVDANMTGFTNEWAGSIAPGGSIGRSIQFGQTNSVWQKRKAGKLIHSAFNLTSHTSSAVTNLEFSATLGAVAVDETRKIVAGVDFVGNTTTPDAVAFYDISDPSTPMLIGRYNFPAPQPGNANWICQIAISGNRVYALDGNAGFVVLDIIPPVNAVPPSVNVAFSGGNVTLTWSDSTAILQSTTSLSPPISWSDISSPGQTSVVEPASGNGKFYRLRK